MSSISPLKSLNGTFRFKLLVSFLYVLLIIITYYTAVYLVNYPHATRPVLSIGYYEYLIRQAFGEEVMYRLFPLALAVSLFGVNWIVLSLVIVSVSTYFAIGHIGLLSLFPVGVAGVLLSLAFLQFGGYDKKYLNGLLWCGFIHSFCNFSFFVFVPALFFN